MLSFCLHTHVFHERYHQNKTFLTKHTRQSHLLTYVKSHINVVVKNMIKDNESDYCLPLHL